MRKLFFPILAASLAVGCGPSIEAIQGDYQFLKNGEEINVKSDYSDMIVGRDLPEEQYVSERVEDRNRDEPGKGDKWKEAWYGAREERYEPRFMELFNKHLADTKYTASKNNKDAKYTLIVHTFYTEPGFHVGVVRKPAEVSFEYIFVETDNPDKVLAKFKHEEVPGAQAMGYDFDTGSRLTESYAKAAKDLAKEIEEALED